MDHLYNRYLSLLGIQKREPSLEALKKVVRAHMPDLHLVNIVTTGNREFLVDTGYAAPFSEPLPLDLPADLEIITGTSRYLLRHQDADGCHRMELYRDGVMNHGYRINPLAREIHEFEVVIGNSFRPEATFMNNLMITRFDGGKFLSLQNMTLTESTPESSNHQTAGSTEELAQVVEQRFGIPEEIVLESIAGMELTETARG